MKANTQIKYTSITHTNGPKGKILCAIAWYWLTKDLVPERHVDFIRVPPQYLEEQCAQRIRGPKSVCDGHAERFLVIDGVPPKKYGILVIRKKVKRHAKTC